MVKLIINISNKAVYTFLLIIAVGILAVGIYAYMNPIPDPGHGADTTWLLVNGIEKTFQQAIDDRDFVTEIATIEAKKGYDGMTGDAACASIGKKCVAVLSHNYIFQDAACGALATHCSHVCATWYGLTGGGDQAAPQGVETGQDLSPIHDCTAKIGEYTTYLDIGIVRCNGIFSALCT